MPKKELNITKKECKGCGCRGYAGGVYGLGFLGALFYYLQNAVGFWNGVLSILKAIVWPAFVVYKLLGL